MGVNHHYKDPWAANYILWANLIVGAFAANSGVEEESIG